MFKYVFVGLLLIFAGSFIMHFVAEHPSAVFISVGDTTIEFSLWFGLFLYFLSIGGVYLLTVLLKSMLHPLLGGFSWYRAGKGKKAKRRTQSGLVHFIEGNWLAAKKELLSAAKDVDKPLVHYLAAAKSAYEMGNLEETQFLLHQAEKLEPKNELAVAVSQARIYLSDKKYEQCLATLMRLKPQAQANPVILDLLREAYLQLHDWEALAELLPELKSSGLLAGAEFAALEQNTYLALLDARLGAAGMQADKLAAVWQSLPKAQKRNSQLIGLYCTYLAKSGADAIAEQLIRKTLKSQWHCGLVELYGKLTLADKKAQLATAEAWLRDHKEDSHLYFALGRVSVKNELWGKARDYFEASIKIKERPEVYAELGALMAKLGEHEKSTALYQKGLLLLKTA